MAPRRIIAYLATSADGFITRPDGDVEWLNRRPRRFDYGMRAITRIREWSWIEVLRQAVHANRSLVFTFKPQAAIRSSFISHACVIIERLGGEVVFVALTCPGETIEARIENEDRRLIGKLASLSEYRRLRDQGAFQFRTMPTPAVKIDTSQCGASEAAARIVALLDA